MPLLDVKNLKTYFYTDEGVIKAVDGVSFEVGGGESLGIVGESACGKSVTAFSIMRIVPSPPGKIMEGEILFKGRNLLDVSEDGMQEIRGREMSMVFQEPQSSLNPVFTIGNQMIETIMLHQQVGRSEARSKAVKALKEVGISSPEERLRNYPHQLSGGMQQRVMIAMALSSKPSLFIADEPTTALDVTVQAQILELIRKLKESSGMSLIIISHDLGVIAEIATKVAVMYAGWVVEKGDVDDIFHDAKHPYTRALLESIPKIDASRELKVIKGQVPNPLHLPKGCRFHPRCPKVFKLCAEEVPGETVLKEGHVVRCHLYDSK